VVHGVCVQCAVDVDTRSVFGSVATDITGSISSCLPLLCLSLVLCNFFYQIRVLSISACSTGVKGRRVGYFRASEFMSRVLVQDFSHFLFS
jgi:hypothetical protein